MKHTVTVSLANHASSVDVTVDDEGPATGPAFLVLHGGAGPFSVRGLAGALASQRGAHVIAPTHPGFDGTARPASIGDVRALAQVYVDLLEKLALTDVTVVGSSVGGWIAAEIAALKSKHVTRAVLMGATGLVVPGHAVPNFFTMSPAEQARASYHQPEKFMVDPSTLTAEQQAQRAGNRGAIQAYAGASGMTDTTLRERLAGISIPVLAMWGESDGIVTPDYGREYAAAIPGARFLLVESAGHMPQLEQLDRTTAAIWDHAVTRV